MMFTWHLDRLPRAATWCWLAGVLVSASSGVLVTAVSDIDAARGGLLVGTLLLGVGGLAGSIATTGVGLFMVGTIAAIAELPVGMLVIVGAAQFVALWLIDLSISVRRSASIAQASWRDAITTPIVIVAVGATMFAFAWLVATLSTWQAFVVPFVVLGIGYVLRLTADLHANRTGP